MIGNKDKITVEIDLRKAFFSCSISYLNKIGVPIRDIKVAMIEELQALNLPSKSLERKELARYVINQIKLVETAREAQKS